MKLISVQDENIDLSFIINELDFLNPLDDELKRGIVEHIAIIELNHSDFLMKKGDPSDFTYFVYSGRLAAFRNNNNWHNSILGFIEQGEVIGEIALINNVPRQAGVIALRKSILIRIPNKVLISLMHKEPQITLQIASLITDRMKNMMQENYRLSHATNIRVISAFPAGTSQVSLDFINKLAVVLSDYANSIIVDKRSFQLMATSSGYLSNNKLSYSSHYFHRFLAWLENNYELVVLVCSPEDPEWFEFCLKNSDNLLHIALNHASNKLNIIEQYIESHRATFIHTNKQLVCVHSQDNTLYKETSRWCSSREIDEFYHVSLTSDVSMKRFARFLTKKSVSLILSGGGTLGLAHIGVLRAIKEAGIEIDAVAGVSMGSIIAALYTIYFDEDKINETLRHALKKRNRSKLLMWQLPVSSLINPSYMRKILYSLFNDINIEDLSIPFNCLACNLMSTEDTVFSQGSLLDAVLASNSLPGIMSPTLINRQLFIDGGVANTLPVDVMKYKYCSTTIAVNVSQKRNISIHDSYSRFPTTVDMIMSLLNPFKKSTKFPLINEIISRSVSIGNKRMLTRSKELTDYLIEPDFSQMKRFKRNKFEDLIEFGYQQAKIEIEKWTDITK